MTTPAARPEIAAMPRYVPGARGDASGPAPIKLSSNENPYPPLPSVQGAIEAAACTVNRYPDMFAVELTEAIADRHGVGPAQVAVGGGSVAALGHVLQAYCAAGDEVVFAWRSFEAYPILAAVAAATPVRVPLGEGARHDLEAMAAAITERTKVVLVCSPNNPTGPAVRAEEFTAFMNAVPAHVVVVLDEAYVEFITDPAAVNGDDVLGRYPNLIVTRTFSKAYGLAGLRVGYAVGPEELIAPVRACVTPFSVNALAQTAALASLAAEDELRARVSELIHLREQLTRRLAADGWRVPDAQGNFFWLAAGEEAVDVAAHLAAQPTPIIGRPFAGEGVRVNIGTSAENEAVLAALASYPNRF